MVRRTELPPVSPSSSSTTALSRRNQEFSTSQLLKYGPRARGEIISGLERFQFIWIGGACRDGWSKSHYRQALNGACCLVQYTTLPGYKAMSNTYILKMLSLEMLKGSFIDHVSIRWHQRHGLLHLGNLCHHHKHGPIHHLREREINKEWVGVKGQVGE